MACSNRHNPRWQISKKRKREKSSTKRCRRCHRYWNLSEFNQSSTTKDGFQPNCRICQKNLNSEYAQKKIEAKRARRAIVRAKLYDYLLLNPCKDCGESDPVVLQFDHRDPTLKKGNVSEMVQQAHTWCQIRAEIDKCDVVCANCHTKRTSKQFNWWYNRIHSTDSVEN